MPNRRKRYFSARKVERLRMKQNLQCAGDVFVIVERFAHAHEHDIRNAAIEAPRGGFLGDQNLFDDFAGGEMAEKSERCRAAKCAAEFAADLRRDAKRQPVGRRDEHRFDDAAVGQRKCDFIGAVFGDMLLRDGERREFETFAQLFAQRFGDIRHFVPRLGAFFEHPTQNLRGSEFFFAEFAREYRFERFGQETADVGAQIGAAGFGFCPAIGRICAVYFIV